MPGLMLIGLFYSQAVFVQDITALVAIYRKDVVAKFLHKVM